MAGVAHYLIHLYDTPTLAEKGLDAAKRYAQIAPAAPPMPSHILTRVGYWNESIGSNAEARSAKASNEAHDELHATTSFTPICRWGRDGKAQAVLQEMRGISGFTERFIAGPYALAVSVTRSRAATGMWQRPYQCGRARWRMSKP